MLKDKNMLGRIRADWCGATLLELAVATTVMILLMTMMVVVFRKCVDLYSTTGLQGHLQDQARAALERVAEDVREAVAFNPANPTQFLVDVREPTPGEFVRGNDRNGNAVWDVGETYNDANGDGLYDGPQDILLLISARARVEEPFTDSNDNGSYDAGEPFEDLDGDGSWTDPNLNRRYEPAFRTVSSPVRLLGKPDPHSLIIYATRQTQEGIRQLVKYTVYRVETDLNRDGSFENRDDEGDGVCELLEDCVEGTSFAWAPPYTIVSSTSTTFSLQDVDGNSLLIMRSTGKINGAAPANAPVVVANDVNSFDVSLRVMGSNTVLAHIQVGLKRNVASFNPSARHKGRAFASLTTSASVMN